jgi:hypothetical protein
LFTYSTYFKKTLYLQAISSLFCITKELRNLGFVILLGNVRTSAQGEHLARQRLRRQAGIVKVIEILFTVISIRIQLNTTITVFMGYSRESRRTGPGSIVYDYIIYYMYVNLDHRYLVNT